MIRSVAREVSGADQRNRVFFDVIGALRWFPVATDRIVGRSLTEDPRGLNEIFFPFFFFFCFLHRSESFSLESGKVQVNEPSSPEGGLAERKFVLDNERPG